MENSDILKKKYLQEKELFKIDVQAWHKYQQERSDELNRKMQEILSIKNELNLEKDISSSKREIDSDSSREEIQKRDELIIEIDKLKYKYDSKFQQMKQLKNNLQKEKLIFESHLNDLRDKIKKDRNDKDKIQKEMDKKSNEIFNKNNELNKKEKILKEQNDYVTHMQDIIKEKNNKNIKDEKFLEIAEHKKNISYQEILGKEEELKSIEDKIKNEIKSLEDDKEEIFKNKNEIEQLNREIKLRMQCLNDINNNNFIKEFNNLTNEIHMKDKKDEINSEFSRTYNIKEKNINEKDKFDKFKTNSFNSELYLIKLKNRIYINRIKIDGKYDTTNRKFDHEKEQEFLIKSYESLNKVKK